ncbi:Protein of unknown function [Gryllus bimaculatus]|nr:Protein of unknown function [Gryllus bimaculatus]
MSYFWWLSLYLLDPYRDDDDDDGDDDDDDERRNSFTLKYCSSDRNSTSLIKTSGVLLKKWKTCRVARGPRGSAGRRGRRGDRPARGTIRRLAADPGAPWLRARGQGEGLRAAGPAGAVATDIVRRSPRPVPPPPQPPAPPQSLDRRACPPSSDAAAAAFCFAEMNASSQHFESPLDTVSGAAARARPLFVKRCRDVTSPAKGGLVVPLRCTVPPGPCNSLVRCVRSPLLPSPLPPALAPPIRHAHHADARRMQSRVLLRKLKSMAGVIR